MGHAGHEEEESHACDEGSSSSSCKEGHARYEKEESHACYEGSSCSSCKEGHAGDEEEEGHESHGSYESHACYEEVGLTESDPMKSKITKAQMKDANFSWLKCHDET